MLYITRQTILNYYPNFYPMAKYYFYSRNDLDKEPVSWIDVPNRLKAAKLFAKRKQMSLKQFLSIFTISK